jgi:hypothetical protein
MGVLLKSVSRLSEFGSIRIGWGLVRPFDRLRAVSEVEPQAHYKSATYRFFDVGFAFSLNTMRMHSYE